MRYPALDFWKSMISMFVLMGSGENYTELIYPALDRNYYTFGFFCVVIIVGMFTISAMVTGVFEDAFHERNESYLAKITIIRRTGFF